MEGANWTPVGSRRCKVVAPLRLFWWRSGWDWRRDGIREIANEEDELPALVVGELFTVRGHGFVASGDDVEKFAVSDFFEAGGLGEIGRTRIVHFGLRTISLSCFAVAFGTFVQIDRTDLFRAGFWIERKRIFHLPGFKRHCPETAHEGGVGEIGG